MICAAAVERAVLLLFLSITVASAQETPTFRSGVSNVRIDVQVTQDETLVRELGLADFELTDEGRAQALLYAALDTEPIDVLLLLDVSGSMRDHVVAVADVATESLLRHLRKSDRIGVMIFAKTAKLGYYASTQ